MYLFSNGAFYAYALRTDYGDAWPDIGVDVSDDDHAVWVGNPPADKTLGTGSDGAPIWVDAPKSALTYAQELTALNTAYASDRLELCQAWLVAAVADGVAETERKADVEAELNELDAQHADDIAELKTKYGVS